MVKADIGTKIESRVRLTDAVAAEFRVDLSEDDRSALAQVLAGELDKAWECEVTGCVVKFWRDSATGVVSVSAAPLKKG